MDARSALSNMARCHMRKPMNVVWTCGPTPCQHAAALERHDERPRGRHEGVQTFCKEAAAIVGGFATRVRVPDLGGDLENFGGVKVHRPKFDLLVWGQL